MSLPSARSSHRLAVVAALVAATVITSLLVAAGPAWAAPANFSGASADGKVVFFATTDKLVPGDTDSKLDVYERSFDAAVGSYVTREVSTGPTGGNDAFDAFYAGATPDGDRVFFATAESVVAGDADRAEDIYRRDLVAGTTVLVSAGSAACAPACGGGAEPAVFFGVSGDGSRADFVTAERLAAADTDDSTDVYQRDVTAATTTLVSQGTAACTPTCGNGVADAIFQGASPDGSQVFFVSDEKLTGADTDNLGDLYARDLATATTTLVSTTGTCPPAADCTPAFAGLSSDGSRVFFETNERLQGLDTDSSSDLYEWHGGAVALVSTGPGGGNGPANATYAANAAAGTAVFFSTSEQLLPADVDSAPDVYERSAGVTSLISIGPSGGNGAISATLDKVSADGGTAIFSTSEALVEDDIDAAPDVYSRAGGTTNLLSTASGSGNGNFSAGFGGASSDAATVFFATAEALLPEDTDSRTDIYRRAGTATTLVSTGPVGHNGGFDPNLSDVSANGARAIFITDERLTEGDLDTERDVYDFSASGTLLASVGNSLLLGPPTPALTETNPASPGASLIPAVIGQSEAETSIKIYPSADCSGAPVGTGTALELGSSGIAVTVEAGSLSTFRATATDGNGDTSACSSSSVTYRQQDLSPPEESGGGGGEGGSAAPVPVPAPVAVGAQPTSPKPSGGKGGAQAKPGAIAPQTKVTFAPLFKTRARRPVIGFIDTTGQEGTTFSCRVDRQPWAQCASPYRAKRLPLGRHVFRVKGSNGGIWEAKPVVRRFKVVSR